MCLAVLLFGSCRIIQTPQVPGDGEPFDVVRIGDSYAVTLDGSGAPIGVWDLGYPVARREGDAERDRFPVRLIHLRNNDEADEIDSSERWRFFYRSLLGGFASFNVLKWYQTTDLFDVREVRSARTAMLHGWLLGTDSSKLTAAGFDAASQEQVMGLLGGPLAAVPTVDHLDGRLVTDLVDHGLSAVRPKTVPLGNGQVVALANGLPVAVYDNECEQALWLGEELPQDGPSDGWSLGLNTAGTVGIVGAGALVGFPIGTPFSIYSSIRALAPFRREDESFAARGRLLGYLIAEGSELPSELQPYRERWIHGLRHQLKAGNRYWPATPDGLTASGWDWLNKQAEAALQPN